MDGQSAGLVLRAAGGTLLGLSDCAPLGGCTNLSKHLSRRLRLGLPAAASTHCRQHHGGGELGVMDGGSRAQAAGGGVLLGLVRLHPVGRLSRGRMGQRGLCIFNDSNAHPLIADSTMVGVRGGSMDGLVGRAAGGALLGLSDCTPLGGCPAVVWVNQRSSDSNYSNAHPLIAHSTMVGVRGGSMDGLVGRVLLEGVLLGLSDCTPLGGCPAVVWVNVPS